MSIHQTSKEYREFAGDPGAGLGTFTAESPPPPFAHSLVRKLRPHKPWAPWPKKKKRKGMISRVWGLETYPGEQEIDLEE